MTQRLDSLGITNPLPIQAATIPAALAGRDVCGQAPTGSGKTLAFGIPLVSASRSSAARFPRSLVLVPTRELASQVCDVLASLMEPHSNRVVALFGGTSYVPQRRALRRGVDIVVACPGRLEDLVSSGDVHLGEVATIVLDEADRMVDMGFVRPVCRLLDQTASPRQVLLFSATMGDEVAAIGRRYQHEPAHYRIAPSSRDVGDISHHFWRVQRDDRVEVTAELIARHGQAFVFCRTKRIADRVARQLQRAGVRAAPLHGDLSQARRTRALADFAARRTSALVATDVMARGIHVDEIPCVVHFDPAADADSYVHRSGRTGRVGSPGTVVSLVAAEHHGQVNALQRALGLPARLTVPGSKESSPPPAETQAQEDRPESRLQGTVKFYDTKRGFGFVKRPDGADVFVHHSKVEATASGRRGLREGDRVVFDLGAGRRGHEAHNVALLDKEAS